MLPLYHWKQSKLHKRCYITQHKCHLACSYGTRHFERRLNALKRFEISLLGLVVFTTSLVYIFRKLEFEYAKKLTVAIKPNML